MSNPLMVKDCLKREYSRLNSGGFSSPVEVYRLEQAIWKSGNLSNTTINFDFFTKYQIITLKQEHTKFNACLFSVADNLLTDLALV